MSALRRIIETCAAVSEVIIPFFSFEPGIWYAWRERKGYILRLLFNCRTTLKESVLGELACYFSNSTLTPLEEVWPNNSSKFLVEF